MLLSKHMGRQMDRVPPRRLIDMVDGSMRSSRHSDMMALVFKICVDLMLGQILVFMGNVSFIYV